MYRQPCGKVTTITYRENPSKVCHDSSGDSLPLPPLAADGCTRLDDHHIGCRSQTVTCVTIREVWQQYSLEDSSHEEDRLTDSNGRGTFPRRSYWTSVGWRILGCLRQIGSGGVHESCGPHSYLVAFGNGIDTIDWADLIYQQLRGDGLPPLKSIL